jgi:hypothetical protein
MSNIFPKIAIGLIFISLLGWALVATYYLQYEASWREGSAYVVFVYRYNLPFWRIVCRHERAELNGEFYVSRVFNITEGWWHLIVKGDVVINAWREVPPIGGNF